ncbi:MAG: hypothetical protein GTN69_10105, partial [Armatimonadetes bacterium]|nr:hypothetical protein [Armatimonadota bacterium]
MNSNGTCPCLVLLDHLTVAVGAGEDTDLVTSGDKTFQHITAALLIAAYDMRRIEIADSHNPH